MSCHKYSPEKAERFRSLWPAAKSRIRREEFRTREEYRKERDYQRFLLRLKIDREFGNPQLSFA